MRKLKKSIKAIIISLVAVVCVLAIVLGCVYGLKDKEQNQKNPSNAYALTEAQKKLASEIIANRDNEKTIYEVLDEVPFECDISAVLSFGENYYNYTDENENTNLMIFRETEGTYEYINLLERFPFTNGKTRVITNDNGYAFMLNSYLGNYTYRLIYFGDFDNPVKILEIEEPEGHEFNSEYTIFNENYFGYCDFYDYVNSYSEDSFNLYVYPLKTTPFTDEEISNENYSITGASFEYTNLCTTDNYAALVNESGVNILSCKDGDIHKKTIAYDNPYGKVIDLTELNNNKILVEVGERLSSSSTEKDYVFDNGTRYKYSYDVITVDGDSASKTSISLNGYARIGAYAGENMRLSDSYVLYRQKVDEDHNLIEDYNCAYYDKDDKLILEYNTTTNQEYILYAGTNTFLTTRNLISSKNSTKMEKVYEFVEDIVEGKYELYTKKFKSKVFPIRIDGGKYGLMDIDGNIVLDPEEFSFRPYLITDNYAIGYHDEEKKVEGDSVIETTYYKYDFTSKQFTKLNLETDVDYITLLEEGFDGYFEKDANEDSYTLKSGAGTEIVSGKITNISPYSVFGGAVIKLDDKCLYIKSDNYFKFKTNDTQEEGEAFVNDYGSNVESYGTIESYITDELGTTTKHYLDTSNYLDDKNQKYHIMYFAPSTQGKYYTKTCLYYKYYRTYHAEITTKNKAVQQQYDIDERSAYIDADAKRYDETSVNFMYYSSSYTPFNSSNSSSYIGYIFVRVKIDADDDGRLKFIQIEDDEYDYAKFKITLNCNGGTAPYDDYGTLYEWDNYGFSNNSSWWGGGLTTLSKPSRTGYTFAGFYTSASGGTQTVDSNGKFVVGSGYYHSNVSMDSTIATWYAHWTVNQYTINYNYNSGTASSSTSSTSVNYGSVATVYRPSRTGYTFTGWSISGLTTGSKYKGSSTSCSSALFTSSDTSGTDTACASYSVYYYKNLRTDNNGTVTFTAQWSVNKYKITYNYNSGTASSNTSSTSVNYGAAATVYRPSRTGYTFSGWYIAGLTTGNKYKGNTTSCSSSLFISSNTSGTDTACASYSVYYYKNLRTDNNGTVTFTAQWSVNKYKITYNYNSGTASSNTSSTSVNYGAAATVYRPSRIGYTFTGWSISGLTTGSKYKGSSSSCSSALFTSSDTSGTDTACASYSVYYYKNLRTDNNGTVTFTAQWTPISYNLYYNYAGGTSGGSSTTSVKYDSAAIVYKPSRTGYTFTGWSFSNLTLGNKYKGNTTSCSSTLLSPTQTYGTDTACTSYTYYYYKNLRTSSGTVTLTACWRANSYYISYDYAGGSIGSYTNPAQASYDSAATVYRPSKTGYTFTGWKITGLTTGNKKKGTSSSCTSTLFSSTETSGTDTDCLSSNPYYYMNLRTDDGKTVTFTAQWSANTYYFRYVWDGGTSGANAPASTKYDTTFSISNPTKVGYTFMGWTITNMDSTSHTIGSTSTNATTLSSVKDTSFRNLTSIDKATVTFTANWTANSYKITYNFNGGDAGSKVYPTTVKFDQAIFIDNPGVDKFGYHFAGWAVTNATNLAVKYYGYTSSTTSSVAKTTTSFTASVNSASYTGIYFKNLQTATSYTVTLTAQWEANVYNIEYIVTDPKGRPATFNNTPATAKYDQTFTLANPSVPGYRFMGWSLQNLSDECTHYFNSTSFTSTNGSYVNPSNPSELMVLNEATNSFRNLHNVQGATVTLIANWMANTYSITYHFMPSDFDTSTLDKNTINMSNNMTVTKTVLVTYDKQFTLPTSTNSAEDTNGIQIPADVKLLSWVFYTSQQTNKNLATVVDSTQDPQPFDRPWFAQGTEQSFSTSNGLWGADCHAYAIYSFVNINLIFRGVDNISKINDISYYNADLTRYSMQVKTYNDVTLPSTINGYNVSGYMISSNFYDSGLLYMGSITTMTVRNTVYTATGGATVSWGYSSKLAKDPNNPTFYLYIIYEVDEFTVSFKPTTPSAADHVPEGSIPQVTISNGSTYTLPRQGDSSISLNLYGYTISSYTLTDMNGGTHTLNPGAALNPASYSVYKNFELSVNFAPITYKINYQFNGGTEASNMSYPKTATFDEWITVSVPKRTGYTLTQYYVTDCTTVQRRYYGASISAASSTTGTNNTISRTGTITADYYFKNLSSDPNQAVTFYAVWTPKTYNVKIDYGDGTTTTLTATFDQYLDIPQYLRPGYALSEITFTNMAINLTHTFVTTSRTETKTTRTASFTDPVLQVMNLQSANSTVTITFHWTEVAAASYSANVGEQGLNLVQTCASKTILPNVICDEIKYW